MPALLTHYLCGDVMLKLLDDDLISHSIMKYRNLFNLGTQGPDILFYYGALPWARSKDIPEIGNKMHEQDTGQFFYTVFKYISAADKDEKELLSAYMCGYFCHYSLDCHTHPYIFYKTGFVLEGEEHTQKYTCYHRRFETALDVLMLKHLSSKKPAEINPSEFINVSKQDADAIARMYEYVIKKTYSIDLSAGDVAAAIFDMIRITALLRDKYGFKEKLLRRLEEIQGKPPLMSSMILPQEIKDGLDYLNASHSPWHLPWDNSSEFTLSFIEMFEAAAQEAKTICDNINTGKALKLLGSRSFTTGMDCDADTPLKYYDCIYEKKL